MGVIVDVFDASDAAFRARMTRATMNIVREYNADLSLTEGRKRWDTDNRRGWGGYAGEGAMSSERASDSEL